MYTYSGRYEIQDSPFAHLLKTNRPASDTEFCQIKELLVQPVQNLSSVTDEILLLESLVNDLYIKWGRLTKYVSAHRGLLSPVRRLPPEVLQEIFLHCLPTEHNAIRSVAEPPLLLGRICSAWRRIALSTPQLWSTLHIVVPRHSIDARDVGILDRRYESLNVWLSRSGMCPLYITLVVVSVRGAENTVPALWMESLLRCSRRWKSVELKVPPQTLRSLESLTANDVPWLETLTFQEKGGVEARAKWEELQFLPIAPRLHRVSLLHFRSTPGTLTLPWVQLTEFSINVRPALSANDTLDILCQCPNLQRCTLMIGLPQSFTSSVKSITLPVLDSLCLTVTANPQVDLTPLFESLLAPRLRELDITQHVYGWLNEHAVSHEHEHVPFLPLLARPSCQLQMLSVSHLFLSEAALVECVQLLPSLTQLRIDDWVHGRRLDWDLWSQGKPFLGNQVLQALTLGQGSSAECVCPNLKSVKFTHCTAFFDDVLLGFVESRWHSVPAGVARLESADIVFDREAHTDIKPQIKSLCEEGQHLRIAYPALETRYDDSREGLPSPPWTPLTIDA